MESELTIVNLLHDFSWNESLTTKDNFSFFHTSMWAEVLVNSYRYKPFYILSQSDNTVKFLLPLMEINSSFTHRRAISLPFSDHCEPINEIGLDAESFLSKIYEIGILNEWRTIEFRGGENFFPEKNIYNYVLGHSLSLGKSVEDIFNSLTLNTKRNIKKAIRENVRVDITDDFNSIKIFYELMSITRKRHGLPTQPLNFYRQIHESIIKKNSGILMLASHNGKYIAGAMFFHIGNKALFKFGASDMEYKHLRANNLIMWEAITYYKAAGHLNLDFGRTDLTAAGLRHYKLGWGCEERLIPYFKYDVRRKVFIKKIIHPAYGIESIFKHLPVTLLKKIGDIFYKHMG
ncbi:MAG: GNAT family N-acetyltransferase [Ignavibacteriales bacterium]|nr:MAG: GNAT family N-acetyltransferase [Ignavibacteriales bacterium]